MEVTVSKQNFSTPGKMGFKLGIATKDKEKGPEKSGPLIFNPFPLYLRN
jgi:hypothetical protein